MIESDSDKNKDTKEEDRLDHLDKTLSSINDNLTLIVKILKSIDDTLAMAFNEWQDRYHRQEAY